MKSTNELLLVQSDIFELDADTRLGTTITGPEPTIRLGPQFTFVPDFARRFPEGVPSLRECTSLRVSGDVVFGEGVRCLGDVEIVTNDPMQIPAGAILTGAC